MQVLNAMNTAQFLSSEFSVHQTFLNEGRLELECTDINILILIETQFERQEIKNF